MRELADRIVRMTASASRIIFRKLPEDEPAQRCPDIACARALLGWEPAMTLDDGLIRTIDYFSTVIAEYAGAPAT